MISAPAPRTFFRPAVTDLSTHLPFSQRATAGALEAGALELAEAVGLPPSIHLMGGSGATGLEHERRFRMQWWSGGDEPLRASLHHAKVRVYAAARSAERSESLSAAWRDAERMAESPEWRRHLRTLLAAEPAEAAFLRLANRFAQQAFSRAVRWDAVLPDTPGSPFLPLVKLLTAGAWPLGWSQGALQVFVRRPSAPATGTSKAMQLEPSATGHRGHVFLSAQFRDAALVASWEEGFRARGWSTLHGPVREDVTPAESQLGERIRSARAVVGLVNQVDPDFGLPWWLFQELDYAWACGLPVALVCGPHSASAGLAGVQQLFLSSVESPSDPGAADLWRWLGAHSR